MRLFVFRHTVALLAASGLWGAVAAQESITLVGIVRVTGQPDAGDVLVSGRFGTWKGEVRSPAHDIFVYPVPATEDSVRLIFLRTDYAGVALTVSLRDKRFASRILPDVELTPLVTYFRRSGPSTPGERQRLRQHLEFQASLADSGGEEFQRIFRWNLEQYESLLQNDAMLRAEVQSFRQDRGFGRGTAALDTRSDVYRALVQDTRRPSTTPTPWEVRAPNVPVSRLFDLIGDAREPPAIRATAISALLRGQLDPATRERLIGMLRGRMEVSASPALLEASLSGLARHGSPADQARVTASLQSTDPNRVAAALSAMRFAQLGDWERSLNRAIRTHPDVEVRAALIERIAEHPEAVPAPGGIVPAIADALARDTATAVRIAAIRALDRLIAVTADSVAARRALQAALHDTTRLELRAEALRRVQRPPR